MFFLIIDRILAASRFSMLEYLNKKQRRERLAIQVNRSADKTENVGGASSGFLRKARKLISQFMRFGIVGAIAFVIDFGLTVGLTELFSLHYLISATIGFSISVIFNYIASMRFVFTHKEDMSKTREFIIFLVLTLIGLGINNALMYSCVEWIHIHYIVAKIIATAVVMLWNFITRKKFLDAGEQPEKTLNP